MSALQTLKIMADIVGPGVFDKLGVLLVGQGMCDCQNKLNGKVVIITGANAGIGKATTLDLAKRGAKVIMACRNLQKATQARDEVIEQSGNRNVVVRHLDLTSLKSVRKFATDIQKSESHIDILINNAGCAAFEKKWTEDGLEYQMQSNHFGHFLLTNLLLDLLKKAAKARIINVSSRCHLLNDVFDVDNLNFKMDDSRGGFYDIYNTSKLCNVLFTKELAKRLADSGSNITVNALHPGVVATEFTDEFPSLTQRIDYIFSFMYKKTPHQGAQTTIHLAISDELENVTGQYFDKCKAVKVSKFAEDPELAAKLWQVSEQLVGLV